MNKLCLFFIFLLLISCSKENDKDKIIIVKDGKKTEISLEKDSPLGDALVRARSKAKMFKTHSKIKIICKNLNEINFSGSVKEGYQKIIKDDEYFNLDTIEGLKVTLSDNPYTGEKEVFAIIEMNGLKMISYQDQTYENKY